MKIPFFTLLALFLGSMLLAQNFEGKVVYKNVFESKVENLSSEKFEKLIGSEQAYFLKEGDYLSVTNGQITPVLLYKHLENRIYTRMGGSDTVYCIDASIEKNKIIESKVEETSEVIAGYKCRLLILKTQNNTVYKYFFSDEFKINIVLFKNHHYNHWYSYLEKSHSLPLKIIMENNQFKMTSTASLVERKKLENNAFQLPNGAILKCK